MSKPPSHAAFVDYVALVYHEARNVRHLVRAGHVDTDRYARLIDGLATNRNDAWRDIQRLRIEALGRADAAAASDVFSSAYSLSLDEIVKLFELPFWKGSSYGGNRWAPIAVAVRDLRDVLMRGDIAEASRVADAIRQMKHNTGKVGEKLTGLDAAH